MIRTIYRKRLKLLVLTLIMSAFLILTTSFAFGETEPSETTSYSKDTPKTTIEFILAPTTMIYSASEYIKAKSGGYMLMGQQNGRVNTMGLAIPKGALDTNAVVTVSFNYDWACDTIDFVFGPSIPNFSVPLELFVSWADLDYFGVLNDPTLMYFDGTPVESSENDWGIVYYLSHFSIYYYGRR